MAQQYAPPPDRQESQTAQPDVLSQLEKRRRELAAEEEERRQQQETMDAARREVRAQEDVLQNQIDQLLSSSPEDFVIRFLQTEGQ